MWLKSSGTYPGSASEEPENTERLRAGALENRQSELAVPLIASSRIKDSKGLRKSSSSCESSSLMSV